MGAIWCHSRTVSAAEGCLHQVKLVRIRVPFGCHWRWCMANPGVSNGAEVPGCRPERSARGNPNPTSGGPVRTGQRERKVMNPTAEDHDDKRDGRSDQVFRDRQFHGTLALYRPYPSWPPRPGWFAGSHVGHRGSMEPSGDGHDALCRRTQPVRCGTSTMAIRRWPRSPTSSCSPSWASAGSSGSSTTIHSPKEVTP